MQRVQRHQRMAILFRYTAQARAGLAAPAQPASFVTPAFLSAQPAHAGALPPRTLPAEAPTPARQADSSPVAEALPTGPGQETGNEITSKEWQRLETIFRKHQERGAAEEQPAASEQQATSYPLEAPKQPAEIERASAAPDPGLQRRVQDESAGEQAPSGRQPAASGPAQAAQLIPETPQTGPVTASLPEAQPPPAALQTPAGLEPPASEPLRSAPAPGLAEPAEAGFPLLTSMEADETASSGDEPGREQLPGELALHPLPLESTWPVQRRQAAQGSVPGKSETSAPGLPAASEPPDTSAPPVVSAPPAAARPPAAQEPPRDLEPPPADIMLQVSPARSTTSSIEVVPPRRPRSAGTETAGAADAAQDAEQAEPVPFHQDVPPGEAVSSISRQPATDAETAPAAAPEQPQSVPTEIGPLPGDLWRLIGEVPPTSASVAKVQPDRKETVMRKSSPEQPGAAPSAQPAAPDILQASLASEQPSPALAGSIASDQKPEGGPGDPSEVEINMDELARRVYAEIRRRISIEWERRRR